MQRTHRCADAESVKAKSVIAVSIATFIAATPICLAPPDVSPDGSGRMSRGVLLRQHSIWKAMLLVFISDARYDANRQE